MSKTAEPVSPETRLAQTREAVLEVARTSRVLRLLAAHGCRQDALWAASVLCKEQIAPGMIGPRDLAYLQVDMVEAARAAGAP